MSSAPTPIRVQIKLKFDIMTPLSVGATGNSGGIADKAILRDGWNRPIIPGSQIKGRLRHACEQVARALGCPLCAAPHPDVMCPADSTIERLATESSHRYRAGAEPRQCVICALFGSPAYPSPLAFTDAAPAFVGEQRRWEMPGRLRPGVGIDRHRGTAAEAALYTIETTNTGLQFDGAIAGRWQDTPFATVTPLIGLLVAGVRLTTRWGGGSSRGLGWATTEHGRGLATTTMEISINEQAQDIDALLREVATLCPTVS